MPVTRPSTVQPPATISRRVLAIDPSLRSTGFAVLERIQGGRYRALEYGVIKNSDKMLQTGCLSAIRSRIAELVTAHQPDTGAVEAVIFVQSLKTAIVMGCARGAALVALADYGLPIYEYAPRRVKQAVVGRGGAEKAQVSFMVRAMVQDIAGEVPADAADAIAIGVTHFQTENSAVQGAVKLERI